MLRDQTTTARKRGKSEIFSKLCEIKPKSDCIYHFPVDKEPNGRPFGSKSIEKW